MIQLRKLQRSHKTPAGQTWVLRRIGLDIREGEFITIMGPSGACKSSLLNVLALLDDQWEGEYWFGEQAVHAMKRKQRAELAKRNVGMVFQSYHLLDDLTVQENIDLPLSYKDIPHRQRQSLVADALDRFQMVGKRTCIQANCPADNSNSSELRGPLSTKWRCCWRMNPRAIFTPRRPRRSWNFSAN